MKHNKTFTLFLFTLLICLGTYAQQKKPKVALVLSGGGAKGIAHAVLNNLTQQI